MILSNISAAMNAALLSVRYGRALEIRGREWIRYLKKSISFGLCYEGLGAKRSIKEAWRAGEAAFLCCAYDVVTDWRSFSTRHRCVFETILSSCVAKAEYDLAMSLYEKERQNLLTDDGLERGPIALRFALQMMGCAREQERAWGGLEAVGKLLQIVDDVLDYEEDVTRGDTNCLTSENRRIYLELLAKNFSEKDVQRVFGPARSVLVIVIGQARAKALILLQTESLCCEILPSSPSA